MPDGTVGVSQSPTPDRLIDNLVTTNDVGTQVYKQKTADYYRDSEYLADQTGAGAVLTFTFTSEVHAVFIRPTGGIVRVAMGAGTPSASLGAYVGDSETAVFPRATTTVKVFAPSGTVVTVWGYRY